MILNRESFQTPSDNSRHISEEHAIQTVRCPSCLKLFKTYTGLIAHFESAGSRCRLKGSEKFGQAIDLFSGGFLAANVERRPDISVAEDGFVVGHMKYEAAVPQDFAQQDATTVGRNHAKKKGSNGFASYGVWN
jgi:hypothetical protein